MRQRKPTSGNHPDHTLPSRRERLRILMRLKSQRQLLVTGIAVLAAVALTLAMLMLRQRATPDIIPLGKGIAAVEGQAPAHLQPVSTAAPLPSPGESPIGEGHASYYGKELAGNRTASGERFDPARLTAAHRTLPIGSRVRVTNPRTGADVIVRINDRGPFHGNRVIDLSTAAARSIGLLKAGTGRVRLALIV